MSLHELPCTPSGPTMHLFVQRLFAGAGMRGRVELAWTDPAAPHALSNARTYDLADLDEIVEDAIGVNTTPNRNIYVSAGLRRGDVAEYGRTLDADVIGCVACWADFDGAGAFSAALDVAERIGLRPNIVVFTGQEPHLRGQLWWVLEEPCEDFELHRRLQRGLAQRLGGDPSVINPGRVMRMAGSVAWPLKQGRTLEMTGLYEAPHRMAMYALDEIENKLRQCGALDLPTQSATVLDFGRAEPQLDLASMVAAARSNGQWHNNALKATAHLLGRGTPPEVTLEVLTPLLTQPGYTQLQTWNDLRVMIDGAVKRGFYRPLDLPAPDIAPLPEQNPFMTVAELMNLPPVEWMIESFLPMMGQSAIFAPPGAFKSFLALDMGLSVAYGLPWHGFATRQRKTLYVLAEGKHGFASRVRVWQEHRANKADTDQFVLLPQAVNLIDAHVADTLIEAISTHLGGVGFIIIDTVARNFGGGDENSTRDMNAYVSVCQKLVDKGCNVLHVHHTGKNEGADERGSSAFRGALDTSLKLDRERGTEIAVLYTRKQKDGPEAKPLAFTFPVVEASHPDTGEVLSSRVPTLAPDAAERASGHVQAPATGLSKVQRALIEQLKSGVGSVSLLVTALGLDRSNVRRALARLSERGLVETDANGFWKLTEKDEEDQ